MFDAIHELYELQDQDRAILVKALEAWDRAEQARQLIADDGLVILSRLGERKPHPAVAIERDSRTAFLAGMRQFGDLLCTPPATKSLDQAGEIVDVKTFPNLPGRSWVTAQLGKRDRWLEIIRQRVKDLVYQLTPALAKMLGLEDDGALLEERTEPSSTRLMRELDPIIQRTAS